MRFRHLTLGTIVGVLFAGHGLQKLFGWFGGGGLDATATMFENIGLRPGKRHAIAAGAAEAGGGVLLATGAANPIAASVLTATMITAIRRVHFKNGPWATNGGYEYNLVLIAAVLALAPPRGEDRLGREWAWSIGALAAGAIGAAGAELVAQQAPAPPAQAQATSNGSGPEPVAATATSAGTAAVADEGGHGGEQEHPRISGAEADEA
jgi:putative oxidoreductase